LCYKFLVILKKIFVFTNFTEGKYKSLLPKAFRVEKVQNYFWLDKADSHNERLGFSFLPSDYMSGHIEEVYNVFKTKVTLSLCETN
jgi:hypothetical protein